MKELVCEHLQTNNKRYLYLSRPFYSIGKGLQNDIVLLDAQVPSVLARIHKKGKTCTWKQGSREIDLAKSAVVSHGFRFKVVEHQPKFFFLVALIAMLGSFLFVQMCRERISTPKTVITLPAKGPFGSLDPKSKVKNALFTFATKLGMSATLHFISGNIDHENDIEVLVNNKFLMFAPLSPNKWNVETKMFVPESLLLPKDNQLEFRYHGNGNLWGIKEIYVEYSGDKPSSQTKQDLLKTAEKFYHERNFKKGNLVRALQILTNVKSSYEAKKQQLPEKYESLLEHGREDKKQLILDYTMAAKKFSEGGYKDKALKIYNNLLLELIDPVDPDRTQTIQEMKGLL